MTQLLSQFIQQGDQGDVSLAWNRAIAAASDDEVVVVSPGAYETSAPLEINKRVHVVGLGASIKARSTSAVRITAARASVVGLEALGGGKQNLSIGFDVQARCRLLSCVARNFGKDGFALVGDVHRQPPTSASISLIVGCESTGNRGRGFVVEGGDANACLFLGCSARSCDGEFDGRLDGERKVGGYHDRSFLGSYFVACHGGEFGVDGDRPLGYCATKPGSRSLIVGCYQEMSNEVLVTGDNVAAWCVGPTAPESTGGVFRGGSVLGRFTFEALFGVVRPRLVFSPTKIDGYLAEIRSALDDYAFALVRDTTGPGAGYWCVKQANTDARDVIRIRADGSEKGPPDLWLPLNAFLGPTRKPITDAWLTQVEQRLAAAEARLSAIESTG